MGDWSAVLIGVVAVGVALPITLAGFGFAGQTIYLNLQAQEQLDRAQPVEATVMSTNVTTVGDRCQGGEPNCRGIEGYRAVAPYTYAGDGTTYRSSQVKPDIGAAGGINGVFENRSPARQVVAQYEPNETVTAYYYPDAHGQAVLIKDVPQKPLSTILFESALFLVFGFGGLALLLAFAWTLRRRRSVRTDQTRAQGDLLVIIGLLKGVYRWGLWALKVVIGLGVLVGLIAVPAMVFSEETPGPDGTGPWAGNGNGDHGFTADHAGPPTPSEWLTPVPTATPPPAVSPSTVVKTEQADNPWGRKQIVVAVENSALPDRGFLQTVRSAIRYWEANPESATYPFDFVLRPDAADPDILVTYRESLNCTTNAEATGCAPRLEADSIAPDPAVVQVLAESTDTFRSDRKTVIHELGHVLGLDHCVGPTWVMGTGSCTTRANLPDVIQREFAWRDTTLRIYVDYSNVSSENLPGTKQQVRLAFGFYADGANGTVPESVRFRRVSDPWAADIVVHMNSSEPCASTASFCGGAAGPDVDGDGHIEYYTSSEIYGGSVPVRSRGWYLGWHLGNVLTPDGNPLTFDEHPRNDRWWE